MIEKLIPKAVDGDGSTWTPRQALLRALQECDEWSAVVIVGLCRDGDHIRGIQSTPGRVVRMGMLADATMNDWEG